MDNILISGLHHVTALAAGAQTNMDFYAGILGLRMVKRTINFDAPEVYHLYYGDQFGSPGTLMTFFPYNGIARGNKGTGQVTCTSFSIPAGSLEYWMQRLDKFAIEHTKPETGSGKEEFISFEDSDGLGIELVAAENDDREGYRAGHIPGEYAIRGFHGVTMNLQHHEKTASLLTGLLDHEVVTEGNGSQRFSVSGKAGSFVNLVLNDPANAGRQGSGTVHHVAFATDNEQSQLAVRERLLTEGIHVTPVIDRQYFKSIYFREPGGVLFEVATIPPGMAVDEEPGLLGETLQLPPWLENKRPEIESNLEKLSFDIEKFS
jgi:glyoxalase family protein